MIRERNRQALSRSLLGAAAWCALAVMVGFSAIPPSMAEEPLESRREESRHELEAIRGQIAVGEQTRAQLSEEIARLEKDRAAINRSLIDTSARQRDLENHVARVGSRLTVLRQQQAEIRQSLQGRRALLAQVLGVLQRMGREPPPAILISPQDALTAVRSAILLGAVVPEIHAESQVLVTELTELLRIEEEIDDQRQALTRDLTLLVEEEERLNLLLQEKKTLTNNAREELARQSARAAELAAKASNLTRLIETLEAEIVAVRQAAEAAIKAEEDRKRKEAELLAQAATLSRPDFSNMARITPAVEFENAKGMLPLPVSGVEVQSFGQPDALGEASKGISIATRVNARVVSPADGWVVYAGPFRSYGQLLILNAGSGYHVILAGMENIDAELGQFVLAGEPVATMGSRRMATAEAPAMETQRPVLYVEFRKDEQSIDPSPWWADSLAKRVADDS